MSKSSFVLKALQIMGQEDMIKLSEVLQTKQQVSRKLAVGSDPVVWDEEFSMGAKKEKKEEAKILSFPAKTIKDLAPPLEQKANKIENETPGADGSDLVLWQREIAKSSDDNIQKLDAFKGYKKSTEMYVVKTSDRDGKDKIRFASTNGVLVNKKQA